MDSQPKVVGIDGSPVSQSPFQPNEQLIARLRALLEMAESGEITAAAYALQYRDRSVAWGVSGAHQRFALVGAIEAVKLSLVQEMLAE